MNDIPFSLAFQVLGCLAGIGVMAYLYARIKENENNNHKSPKNDR